MLCRVRFSPCLALFVLCLVTFLSAPLCADGTARAASFEVRVPAAEIPLTSDLAAETAGDFAGYRHFIVEQSREPILHFIEREGVPENQSIAHEGVTMHFRMFKIGEPGPDGYPLFIALHGGGGGSKEVNDQQWEDMQSYYRGSVENGIYVATRGIRDTWDTHFNPESYALYDQLIEMLLAAEEVDPNRVYLLGFSAGGDGVYAISPRMPDRFAAVAMSAGHHNGINPTNLYNLPILLQCGQFDSAYDRNLETALFSLKLDELQAQRGGYPHQIYIHLDEGHNFYDNAPDRSPQSVAANPLDCVQNGECRQYEANTNSIDFLTDHVRDPLPQTLYWDLSTRAPLRLNNSFYWLSAPETTNQGTIKASYDDKPQHITVETENVNGPFSILINDAMLDLEEPVTITLNGHTTGPHDLNLDEELAFDTAIERLDPDFVFQAIINIVESESETLLKNIGKRYFRWTFTCIFNTA